MTALMEALAANDAPEGANPCECGCGEFLPPGSSRRFKRGHKNNVNGDKDIWDEVRPELEEIAAATPLDSDPPGQNIKPPVRVTKKIRDDIEGKVGMLFLMLATMWGMKDPFCAEALSDNAENMAAKAVPLICKSPELVRWFTKGGNYIALLEFLMACVPVAQAIAAHHLFKTGTQPAPNPTLPNGTVARPVTNLADYKV